MSGTITNGDGVPLVGASVTVEDTDIVRLSDSYGQYLLLVPQIFSNRNIIVKYFGYDNDTIPIKSGITDISLGVRYLQEREVVYVSTQKKLQTNWEVPITISVADLNKIEYFNIFDPQELSLYSSGYHNQTQSGVYSVNVIRGVASDGSNSYSFFQPRISVFLDGVSITHMGTASTDIFDVQRAEVVKGPQGTLFGKGAEFGAVNYITNKPEDEFEAKVQMSMGDYNQKIVQAMVNTPIKEKMANRLALYYNDRDGFNNNLADHSKLSGKGAISARDIFRFNPDDKVSITMTADYERNREPCVSYKGMSVGVPGNEADVSPFTDAYFNEDNLFVKRDMGGFSYVVDHSLSDNLHYSSTTAFRTYKLHERFDLDGTYQPLMATEEKQSGIQFSEEVRLSYDSKEKISGFVGASYMYDRNKHNVSLTTNMRYAFPYLIRQTLQSMTANLPDSIVKGVDQSLEQVMSGYYKMLPQYASDLSSVVQTLRSVLSARIYNRLTDEYSNMFDENQWDSSPDVYGQTTDIVYEEIVDAIKEVFASDPSAQAFTQFIDPVTVVEGLGLQKLFSGLNEYSNLEMRDDYQENETDINVYHEGDLFADVVYKISDKMFFTLGLRATMERQKTSYCSTSDEAPLVGAFLYHTTNNETYWLHDLELSWVGRAVFNYMLNNNNNAYISLSKGRRPGSIYYNFNVKEAVKLRPETSRNLEIGLKGSVMKNHIVYTLAAYSYNWLNFQSSVSTEGFNGTRQYINSDDGKARAFGSEASVEIYFPRYVSFFGDYSYINGKFTDNDCSGKPQPLAGHRFRMTPDHSADFGFNVEIPLKKKSELYFRPAYSWMSDMYFSIDNVDELSQKAYGLASMSLGVKWGRRKMTYDIGIYGKNIFNEQYLIDAGNTGQMWGYPTYIAGAPAIFGLGIKLGFK